MRCGCSSMVEQKPSKLMTRVRFPSPAPAPAGNRARFIRIGCLCFLQLILLWLVPIAAQAAVVGQASPDSLLVVAGRLPKASIVVAAEAGKWETRAVSDLHDYVRRMSGADL